MLTQHALYTAIRLVSTPALIAPPRAAIDVAGRLGRRYALAPHNRKRLARARTHLRVAFPDWPEDRVHEYALFAYEHLFMLGSEIAFGPRILTQEGWPRHIHVAHIAPALRPLIESGPVILISGHCGNWEVLGFTVAVLGFPMHAIYRPIDLKPLDTWVRQTRQRRGLTLIDKFGAVTQMPQLVRDGAPVAFVADQNGGDRGIFVPFFGRLTSTYKAIGLLALQFNATVVCGMARRMTTGEAAAVGLGPESLRYSFESTDVFGPTDWNTHPDPLFYLTARYRRAIEIMVRKVPEQYLWMHRLWRSRPRHERLGRPFPENLREKLELLPWTDDALLAQIETHSARDSATLASTGRSRLD